MLSDLQHTIENPDCVDADDLYDLIKYIENSPLLAPVELFGSMDDAAQLRTRLIYKYAQEKHSAIVARLLGRVLAATSHERRCEYLYNSMPEDMQW